MGQIDLFVSRVDWACEACEARCNHNSVQTNYAKQVEEEF